MTDPEETAERALTFENKCLLLSVGMDRKQFVTHVLTIDKLSKGEREKISKDRTGYSEKELETIKHICNELFRRSDKPKQTPIKKN